MFAGFWQQKRVPPPLRELPRLAGFQRTKRGSRFEGEKTHLRGSSHQKRQSMFAGFLQQKRITPQDGTFLLGGFSAHKESARFREQADW
jgi:hypothetical protein